MAGRDFSAELFGPSAGRDFSAELFGAKPPEKQSAFRQVADVPLGIARGAVQGVRMIADAFGAGSDTSKTIKSAETYLADLMSAQAKDDQQEISRIMKDAEDKGVLDQVKAGIKAFTIAPVDTLSSALGTAAPVIAGALGAKILGAGALVSTGVSALTGAGMGAGVVKGSIYEETKKALEDAGASKEDAEARAKLAQEYGGKNLDQILLGTVLGGAAAVGPLEKGGAAILARRILGKTGVEATESVAEQAAKGALRRRAEAGLLEAVPEAVQAGQEQVAQNIALQREGFDVPTFRGAFSAATMEALAGFGLGTTIGGGRPEVAAPPAEVAPSVTTEAPAVEVPTAEAPPVETPAAEPPVAETPPIETPTVEPTAEPPKFVTAQMLQDIGVRPSAAIIARLEGLPIDDPKVAADLESYANRFATPEAKPQILDFVQTLRQPVVDQPVTEAPVAPTATTEAPVVEQPEAPPVKPTALTEVPPAETTAAVEQEVPPVAETPAAPEVPAAEPVAPVQQAPVQTANLKTGEKISIETQNSPAAFSNLVRSQFGEPQALVAKNKDGEEIGRLTYMPNGGPIDVSVQEKYRRQGVATALYDAFEAQGGKLPDIESGVAISDVARAVRAAREKRKKIESSAPETPTVEAPPAVEQPATLEEFRERMPLVFDNAEVRAANEAGDFAQLTKALQRSSNPAIRRIGQLGSGVASKITLKKPGRLGRNTAGRFTYDDDAIQMIPSYAGDEHTNAHETLHALIARAQRNPTEKQRPVVQQINKLYEHVKRELKKKGITVQQAYGLKNAREFTAEAMTNPEFQFELMQIPYPGKKTAWTQFVKLVGDLLGIQNTNALTEVMNLVDRLATQKQPRRAVSEKGLAEEVEVTEARPSAAAAGNPGQQAIETIRAMGMDVPKPDPTKLDKAKDIWQQAKEDPKLTAQSAAKALQNFLDKVETWSFSSDAKLNNDYRRAIVSDIKENEGVIGQLLEMSQSQAVHADALASQFMIEGGLKYNDELKKWESFDAKANFPALSKKLDEIGKQYNLSKEQIERVAHAYLVAKRLPGLIERKRQLDKEIAAEQATAKPDKKKIQDLEDKKVFISDKQLEQMEPGLSLGKTIPELNQVVNMWNDIRKNTIDVMVSSGLWSPEYAQAMWDNMDYVPYFREDQIENEKGPQEFIRGLQVKSKEFQLKGSEDAVHDVFDNMIRWTQYAINRSVRAHKALQMIDNSKDIKVGDRKMAEKVTEEKRGMNIVRVFRDGKQELYDMADPLYVQAFAGIQNVSIPTLKFMSKVSDVLRNSVVLYPLFSVAQVPQDAFAAMFTSGLKTQHALKIPYLAVKEFVKTLNKTSQTHEALKKFGATGVRDFSATVIRDDAEIYAGLKPPRGGWGKTKEFLSHISMAADNAVRQAVYEASIQQGVSRSEAIEKAFEVINFRRKGTSKMLNILGQTVPFFYAYLSAQRVAYKVLTGVGISPTDRAEAMKTLAMTSTAVATLSLLYAMANADDEDYMETPANIRDRTITIPGSGGVRIPLRPDFFLFPKIIAEHTYLLLSEQGYQDAAKFRTSMKDALISAIASPTPFPTAIKPAIEVAINYDFFQGKPLIGNFEKQKDLERQFRDSTSEFAKLLGQTGMISPIAADHLIRGMFGSFGGLFLFGTNQFLHSDPDVPRPDMNANEMLAALPGTSGLLKRPQESALKNDFYTLRDEVEKAVNTFNDIKTRSPEGMDAFLADEKQMARLMLGKSVDKINRELSKIRRQITIITNMPESQMSASDKADYKRQLMELERELLRSVNVKELREMAQI